MMRARIPARQREAGVLLLAVALLLATMAALAFGMNRAAGMDAQAVGADYERRKLAYLAEGAVAAAKWFNQARCGSQDLDALSLAGATLSATVVKSKTPKMIDISAAATMSSTSTNTTPSRATLVRTGVAVFDLANPENKDLGGAFLDTYIDPSKGTVNTDDYLVLKSGQSNALLSWDTKDVPADATVLSAKLTLTQSSSASTQRTVTVHQVTTDWDANATWYRARGLMTFWNTAGGDYNATPAASAVVPTSGSANWDLTDLVSAWYKDKPSNKGMLLRLPDPGQQAIFNSREAAGQQRPILNVTFSKSCKL
jgi:hypothetical protein